MKHLLYSIHSVQFSIYSDLTDSNTTINAVIVKTFGPPSFAEFFIFYNRFLKTEIFDLLNLENAQIKQGKI